MCNGLNDTEWFFAAGQNGAGRHLKSVPADQLIVFWKVCYDGISDQFRS